MLGTVLLAMAVIAAVAWAVTGSLWLGVAALIFVVPAVILLYRVGKSLP